MDGRRGKPSPPVLFCANESAKRGALGKRNTGEFTVFDVRLGRLFATALATVFAMALGGPCLAADGQIGVWLTTVVRAPDAAYGASWRAGEIHQNPLSSRSADSQPTHLAGPRPPSRAHSLDGLASYYSQGEKTATGELFDRRGMTAAHPTLPFGAKVRVTRLDTGDSVVVRINDRGPFKPGRVIDLSEAAAEQIRMTGRGLATVKLEVVQF